MRLPEWTMRSQRVDSHVEERVKYRKHGTTWIVRIDRGDELMASLSMAMISGTCELVIQELPGGVDRLFDAETGLNLFDLD